MSSPVNTHALWNNGVLSLPPSLVSAYQTQLEDLGRYNDACGPSPSGIVGGYDDKACHDHFTHRFAASAVRTEFLTLDPKQSFAPISDDLRITFSDGYVSVLDIPCGAGAGILGFLGLLSHLREHDAALRLPLAVSVTAGDFAPAARHLYDAMLHRVAPFLALQGIRLTWNVYEWDATQEPLTAQIVDHWFQAMSAPEEYFVLIAAFSAGGASTFESFSRSFSHITSRLYNRTSTVLWIEPQSRHATTFLSKVSELFAPLIPRWFRGTPELKDSFYWQHPFKEECPEGRVMVQRYERSD